MRTSCLPARSPKVRLSSEAVPMPSAFLRSIIHGLPVDNVDEVEVGTANCNKAVECEVLLNNRPTLTVVT